MPPRWSCRSACSCRRRPRSEARSEAETEVLRLVPIFLLDRNGVVYTDRAERRYPLDADTGRYAHELAVENVHRVRIVGRTPERSDIDESLAKDADLLRQAEREAQLRGPGVVIFAAQRIGRIGITRTDAADPETAQR